MFLYDIIEVHTFFTLKRTIKNARSYPIQLETFTTV